MQRIIKFRQAILNRDGSFQSWHYWGFIEQYGSLTFVGPDTLYSTIAGALKNSSQYTGRKDKNGKEIYEGDLLHAGSWGSVGHYSENTFVVEFFEGVFGGVKVDYSERKDRLSFAAPLRKLEECEVIGNIHSNSELLEVKDGPSSK